MEEGATLDKTLLLLLQGCPSSYLGYTRIQ